jgi:glycosyltransferase involved in cell wall biosynthesis
MKIALCLEYSIGERGGVCVLVETLLQELVRHGHELVLVSPDTPDSLRESEAGRLVREHISWLPSPRPSMAAAQKLARQLADARIDLAHFHLGGNYGWGNRFPFHCPIYHLRRSGIPCLSTVHLVVGLTHGYSDPRWPLWYKLLRLPLAWWGKMQQLRYVRREIAVSRHDFEKLTRWYWPFRSRFVQIYHSRLPSDPVSSLPPAREPVILTVGHIARRKGQIVLAEAFAGIAARHPEWWLEFVGRDSGEGTVEHIRQIAIASRLSERIRLPGERNNAMELMKSAAIYVQPSLEEALGLALQEAMYCGCACVGSRVGGIPELVRDGRTGLLVEPGDAAQLGNTLEKLMMNETLRNELGRAAAVSISERGMTVEAMVKRHLELYETIITGN